MKVKWKKYIALILALVLIVFIGYIYGSFKGNPISRNLAERSIKSYLETEYRDLNMEVSRTKYSFKDSNYRSDVKTDQVDVSFYVVADSRGRIIYDSYDSYVSDKLNTYNRLARDYEEFIDHKLKDLENLDFATSNFSSDEDLDGLEINRSYSLEELPFDKELSIYIYDERKIENMVYYLERIDDIFKEGEFDSISLHLRGKREDEDGRKLSVYNFSRDLIDSKIQSNIRKNIEEYKNY